MRKLNLVGQKFGDLLVLKEHGKTCHKHILWKCLCDCNNIHFSITSNLRNGNNVSCGCRRQRKEPRFLHGRNKTPIHQAWVEMKRRCYDQNRPAWKYYGGRGIKVCDEWLNSFKTFLVDMGEIPSPNHSLNRRNNDGNYTPENCHWATTKEQANNRTNSRWIHFMDETKTMAQWSEITGIPHTTIKSRIDDLNWSIEKALTHNSSTSSMSYLLSQN